MTKTYKELIECVKSKNSSSKTKSQVKECGDDVGYKLLNRATHYRDFEINASWERAKYFTIFLGAIFVCYYSIHACNFPKDFTNFLSILLLLLGTAISFIWYMVNRGSKLIYENWEHHIDFIEESYRLGIISRLHCYEPFYFQKLISEYPISPSKANILVSLLITITFIIALIYEILCYLGIVFCHDILLILLFITIFLLTSFQSITNGIKSSSYKKDNLKQDIYIRNRISDNLYLKIKTISETDTLFEKINKD